MPGVGPILLFDKSLLQSLTIDEAMWLDTFYFPCITPLFFIETLADLEKEVKEGRTPEDVVGNLAEKTPIGGGINVHHRTLWVNELLGNRLELRHVPVLSGGQPVTTSDGRRALVYDSPPETEALKRWQERDFAQVERLFARAWRDALSGIDLDAIFRQGRDIIKRLGRPRDLSAVRAMAGAILEKPDSRYVRDALQSVQPEGLRRSLLERWKFHGSPRLTEFAPYTAHLFLVDLFFCIGLGADLIGRERPSNKIDIAYLYYLPFCMAFTSSDNLHQRTAPLFLDANQVFIPGDHLKADLAKLDAHYSQLSDEEKAKGVMSFAHYPPVEGDFLVSRMWDKLMSPHWRRAAAEPSEWKSEERQADIVAQIREVAEAPRETSRAPYSVDEADAVLIERKVPLYRGKWRMLPPEVEKGSK